MAFPVLERAYSFNVNHQNITSGDDYNDRRAFMLWIHQTMTSWASNPWVMVASSNGVTAGWPGPGWNTIADVIWEYITTPSGHSWMVWETADGTQILMDFTGSNDKILYLRVSPNASFTGGTSAVAPVATEFFTVKDNQQFSDPNFHTCRFHAIHADDGNSDWIFQSFNNKNYFCWGYNKILDPVPGLTYPYVSWLNYDNDNGTAEQPMVRTAPSMLFHNYWKGRQTLAANNYSAYAAAEIHEEGQMPDLVERINDISGKRQMYPVMLSAWGVGNYQYVGRIADVYAWGTGANSGDTIEENVLSPARLWVIMGEMVFPWNGTPPLLI